MAKKKKKPVSIWGIEFDALIDETKSMTSTIPEYPVENGFTVSDTIVNDPITISMTLYVTNTPVTWLYRHGSSKDRVNNICKQIENKWFEKKLTKIVTADTTYTNMGITSISIKKSSEIGYAREISIEAKKVRTTKRTTAKVPKYVMKAGKSKAKAGKASVSKSSSKSTASTSSTQSSTSSKSSSSSKNSKGSSGSKSGKSKKPSSVLYGIAKGMKFI